PRTSASGAGRSTFSSGSCRTRRSPAPFPPRQSRSTSATTSPPDSTRCPTRRPGRRWPNTSIPSKAARIYPTFRGGIVMTFRLLAGGVAAAVLLQSAAAAADRIKVGFISTLSGPSAALGVDIRDGFQLAVKLAGGRIGGLPAEVLVGDDQFKPEV